MQQTTTELCHLSHPGFRMLGEPVFRLSEGRAEPAMVIPLDGKSAVLPLRSLAHEFRIEESSPDGRMLRLIEQALDFVVAIRIGDALPPELFGSASWEPAEADRRTASSRVWRCLVRCVFARTGGMAAIPGNGEPGWENAPDNQVLLRDTMQAAARLLGDVTDADARERVARLIAEQSYIEAMRRVLGRGLQTLDERLVRRTIPELPQTRQETLKQVRVLALRGMGDIRARFDEADALLDDILSLLRDIAVGVTELRRRRDWLVRTNHAWSPVFGEWADAPVRYDEFLWKVIERTYQFLAPRYMPYHEWTAFHPASDTRKARQKVW